MVEATSTESISGFVTACLSIWLETDDSVRQRILLEHTKSLIDNTQSNTIAGFLEACQEILTKITDIKFSAFLLRLCQEIEKESLD